MATVANDRSRCALGTLRALRDLRHYSGPPLAVGYAEQVDVGTQQVNVNHSAEKGEADDGNGDEDGEDAEDELFGLVRVRSGQMAYSLKFAAFSIILAVKDIEASKAFSKNHGRAECNHDGQSQPSVDQYIGARTVLQY